MKGDFFKFPSTPHLADMPGLDIRGDKVLTVSERDELLGHDLIVEEKVDGANLGISFDAEGNIRAQNRGAYLHLPGSGQWKKLEKWLTLHTDALFEHLVGRFILFGEWCYARHSVFYDRLPDWFLAFDVYDRESRRFLSSAHRNRLIAEMGISKVPEIAHGRFSYPDIEKLLSQSRLAERPAEGVYLRADNGEWLDRRAKLVRPEFIQTIGEHWARSTIKPNRLIAGVHG